MASNGLKIKTTKIHVNNDTNMVQLVYKR